MSHILKCGNNRAERYEVAKLAGNDDDAVGRAEGVPLSVRPFLWFREAGFGRVDHPDPPEFADLDGAQTWIRRQLTLAS